MRNWLPAALAAAVLVIGGTGPSAGAAQQLRYVALGDSSAAGPGIPNQIHETCVRSDQNWPHRLAERLDAVLTDVTCTSATTAHLTTNQAADVVPQFAALAEDTDLVTLAIGANDLPLALAFGCAVPDSDGRTCEERFTVNGVDWFAARIDATAPKIAAALEHIHRESPHADVVVVGYLTYWRPDGCYPADQYTAVDANYIQATFDRLMEMLSRQAEAHDAIYVDVRGPSTYRDLCAPPEERWLEGEVPDSPAWPYHPNAAGMAGVAEIVAQALP